MSYGDKPEDPRQEDEAAGSSGRDLYREGLLNERIRAGDIARGADYLYRPNEILVASQDQGLVSERLALFGIHAELVAEPRFGVAHYRISAEHAVPEVLTLLRHPRSGRKLLVAPNHIIAGAPDLIGGPAGFAEAADAPDLETPSGEGDLTVGVLDTGISLDAGGRPEHPFLAGCAVENPTTDNEERDQHPADGHLDDEAGHGTFCSGVVLQRAPGASVAVDRVLASDGFASETDVVDALLELVKMKDLKVLSLSFGAHTEGDAPPLQLSAAIGSLDPSVVVVAAAGNDASGRPFWPAAQKNVIGVGALDPGPTPAPLAGDPTGMQPAAYSNYGWWVDAWAVGYWISTFFLDADDAAFTLPDGSVIAPRHFSGWAKWRGTSFATPAVAGAIAACSIEEGITPVEAAFRLVHAPGVPRVPAARGGGAIVS